jgi:hypothetical protein
MRRFSCPPRRRSWHPQVRRAGCSHASCPCGRIARRVVFYSLPVGCSWLFLAIAFRASRQGRIALCFANGARLLNQSTPVSNLFAGVRPADSPPLAALPVSWSGINLSHKSAPRVCSRKHESSRNTVQNTRNPDEVQRPA